MTYYKSETSTVDDSLWAQFTQSRDLTLRNRILDAYLYIVSANIKRMNLLPICRQDMEDMTNHGILELIKCIDRFDYTRGVQFDSYASIRVRGSLIDYIRKMDFIPHDVRRRVKEMNTLSDGFRNDHEREPSEAELAGLLGISEAELYAIRQDELSLNFIDFEDLIGEGAQLPGTTSVHTTDNSPEDRLLGGEFKELLAKYIDELDPNERTVVSLYYYEELKFKEIAFVMELTPSRISQIHSRALKKLKERIQRYMST